LPSRNEDEYVGVDIGLKSDNGAVVRVRRRDDRLILAGYRLWKPSGQEPLDLESTVEAYLREIASQGNVRAVLVDPWQAARTIATLKAAGIPIEEFPQTVGNTSRMGSTLYDLLKGRNLKLFADEDLRQQAMNTIAIETPRGFRISKEKASRKIDAIVALSMACVAALDRPTAHFDAYDPTPDVDAIIPTIVRGDAEDKQEIDASIVRRMTNGGWFER
jgi:phage terminase large subunit-like protein